MSTYNIHTEVFKGPLELLLALIEKRKLLINDIALAEVTADYLGYLERHPEFPISETAQFVLVGATLLLIKSKSLLPVLSLTKEEESSIEDLTFRLKQLEVYKKRSNDILSLFQNTPIFGRKKRRKREVVFTPFNECTQDGMLRAIHNVLQSFPKEDKQLTTATVRKIVSLEDMMERLTERINQRMDVSFREFTEEVPGGKVNVIVSFLAMLELVREGVVRVEQERLHGDIAIHSDTVGVPRYG